MNIFEARDGGRVRQSEDPRRLPEHRVTVEVPIDSAAYQAYLAANRAVEQAREDTGYVTRETIDALRIASEALGADALSRLGTDRSKP